MCVPECWHATSCALTHTAASCKITIVFSLQVITLEGWVDIMYYVMDAHSFYNFIYFILLIIVSIPRFISPFS